jgi:hypothetical protein
MKTFQEIKANLDRFDRSTLEQWQERVEFDRDSNFDGYIVGVFDFPADAAALRPTQNAEAILFPAQAR